MNVSGLDLNLLVPLQALLELRLLIQAAERVHLSQSAMSATLARLRRHFDDEQRATRDQDQWGTAEPMNELIAKALLNTPTPGLRPRRSDAVCHRSRWRYGPASSPTLHCSPQAAPAAAADTPRMPWLYSQGIRCRCTRLTGNRGLPAPAVRPGTRCQGSHGRGPSTTHGP